MNNETILHFTDDGSGEPALVFLHYFGGSSHTWQMVIDELKNHFRCIAIDLPGFGDSQNQTKKLSVTECAKQVERVIQKLSLQQFVSVGHSMGGKILLSLAAMQPHGLKQIILVAPSPPTPEPMSDEERISLSNAYGDSIALKTIIKQNTAQPLANDVLEKAVADNLRASHIAWTWWLEEGSREDISPQMPTLPIPALIISGEQDHKFSIDFLKGELQQYFSSSTFKVIPGAKHLIPLEAPEKSATFINDAIDGRDNVTSSQ